MRDANGGSPAQVLAQLTADELGRAVPPEIEPMLAEIRRRHPGAVAAIVFYGSCLRTRRYDDGVLDFYVLVDSYEGAYQASRLLAWANAVLPPNVFYVEVRDGTRTLRSKYAVLSLRDFRDGCGPHWLQTIIWARFCQPAQLVHAREPAVAALVHDAVVEAVVTMFHRTVALLPEEAVTLAEVWQRAFAATYGAELRVESAEAVAGLYRVDAERYDRAATAALDVLVSRGVIETRSEGERLRVVFPPGGRWRLRVAWRVRALLGKPLAALRLIKSMATFGDWLPYALWKLERHTGVRIETTPWQRRHPWIACWPVFARLLVRRTLR